MSTPHLIKLIHPIKVKRKADDLRHYDTNTAHRTHRTATLLCMSTYC